jgi:hypothetical protein
MTTAKLNRPLAIAEAGEPDAVQAFAIGSATTLITNLLRAMVWLIRLRICIVRFEGFRDIGGDHVKVIVAPTPRLHVIFGDECAWHKRVEWEEVTC